VSLPSSPDFAGIRQQALTELAAASDPTALQAWRNRYLGRQGETQILLDGLKFLAAAERPAAGKAANDLRKALEEAWTAKGGGESAEAAAAPGVDPTLPGRPYPSGAVHVLTQSLDRITDIFHRLGFALADGPEIETEHHNFDALNTQSDHPARDEADTFYLDLPPGPHGRWLLRTQTSPVQIRVLENRKPPIKIIAPGRCYRRDEVDATHGIFFHQVEGLCVGEGIGLPHLKGVLEFFFRELMGEGTKVRLRPHYFPFTEPSFEVDCSIPGKTFRGKEWLEIAGCGLVHPKVLRGVGVDPEKFSGYAFGLGVERIAMVRHGIPDLRFFYENDVRFLKQFANHGAV
jgi:phenylalanyl-tRNA synthetase alpha chain